VLSVRDRLPPLRIRDALHAFSENFGPVAPGVDDEVRSFIREWAQELTAPPTPDETAQRDDFSSGSGRILIATTRRGFGRKDGRTYSFLRRTSGSRLRVPASFVLASDPFPTGI